MKFQLAILGVAALIAQSAAAPAPENEDKGVTGESLSSVVPSWTC